MAKGFTQTFQIKPVEVAEEFYTFRPEGIFIPRKHKNFDTLEGGWTLISENEAAEIFESIKKIKTALGAYLGAQGVIYQSTLGGPGFLRQHTLSKVQSAGLSFAVPSLVTKLKENGHKVLYRTGTADKNSPNPLERWGHYVDKADTNIPALLNVDMTTGKVTAFPNRTSPLRVGAARINKEHAALYDSYINKEPSSIISAGDKAFTADVFIRILQETKAYAVELLESVNVEPTEAHVTNLLNLLHIKSYSAVKETLTVMPFLKVHRNMDKNLAYLVGEGLSYNTFVMFYVSKNHPSDLASMKTLLSLPEEWLFAQQF